MTLTKPIDELNEQEIARLVETCEARAYHDMMASAPAALCEKDGFAARTFGSAVAIRARSVAKSLNFNRVIGLGVVEPATTGQLDEMAAYYGEIDTPFGIELCPASQPGELLDWLRGRRWRRAFFSAMLYRSAELPRMSHESWAKSTGLRIERVGPKHGDVLGRISAENFGMPDAVGRLIAALTENPAWRTWLALDGDEAVGASLSYVGDDACWLGWTSVLPSHRGRWVHAGIVAREIEDAHESGCRWITTETAASTQSKPDPAYHNLTRFGFRDAYMRPTHMGRPGTG